MFINIPFQTLLYGEKYPCNVGRLPENIPKNRFKTTFPCVYKSSIFFNLTKNAFTSTDQVIYLLYDIF